MSSTQKSPTTDRPDRTFLIGLFIVVLVTHFGLATMNWRWGFLLGHEFRQTQTAIITQYIEKENNFSIRYSTPILGKPWEFPLEFPLYEWSVALLSRVTSRPQFESARAVSLASFYLTLGALYLLLGQAGLPPVRRLVTLSLTLATPVYIFYSRAFLMDTMALMASAWFLAAFVEVMRVRRWRWLVLCAVAGGAGGLIKSLTFFVWLWPAALYGAWCVAKDWRGGVSWRDRLATVAWGFGAVLVPALLVNWWVRYTDAIKETHASAHIFTSKALTQGNFGMYDLSTRFSKQTWKALLECWTLGLTNPWVVAVAVVGGAVLFKRYRWYILGAAGLFLSAQMMFPLAYAYQDYYFTACAVFLMCALGFVLNGIIDSPLPRWSRWVLIVLPFAFQYNAYSRYYYQMQAIKSHGGTGLTLALRDYLPNETVIIVAGSDWAAIIPYYSNHKALMIRNGLENDQKYLDRAFNELSDENVGALVLVGDQRGNYDLVKRAAAKFSVDRSPTFSYRTADVYVAKLYRPAVIGRVHTDPKPEGITTEAAMSSPWSADSVPDSIYPATAAALFKNFHPAPELCRFRFGYASGAIDNFPVVGAHPDSDLWIRPPTNAHEIVWEFGLDPKVYQPPTQSNGVTFIIDSEAPDGTTVKLFERTLDPARVSHDRGIQHEVIPLKVSPGQRLIFRTGPHGDYSYDWAYWKAIDIH
jgi:hypothetical protein